jgi:hypothetical protein
VEQFKDDNDAIAVPEDGFDRDTLLANVMPLRADRNRGFVEACDHLT